MVRTEKGNHSIHMAFSTHKQLRQYALDHDLKIGEAIQHLLDRAEMEDGQVSIPTAKPFYELNPWAQREDFPDYNHENSIGNPLARAMMAFKNEGSWERVLFDICEEMKDGRLAYAELPQRWLDVVDQKN